MIITFNKGGHLDKYTTYSRFDSIFKAELNTRRLTKHTTTGMLYEDMAEKIGVSVNTIMSLRKKNLPSIEVALGVANYFGMKVEHIWYQEDNESYVDDRERCKEDGCNKLIVGGGRCYTHNSEYQREKKKKK